MSAKLHPDFLDAIAALEKLEKQFPRGQAGERITEAIYQLAYAAALAENKDFRPQTGAGFAGAGQSSRSGPQTRR